MNIKSRFSTKKIIIVSFIIISIFAFLPSLTSQIGRKYDIIPPFQAEALDCGESNLCKDLGLEEVELFDKLPVLDMSEYEGDNGLALMFMRGLACLFPFAIILALAVMFKTLIPALAPFGEPTEEKFKVAKKKFVELGLALLFPVFIVLTMSIISIVFGMASPFSSEFYNGTLGLDFGSGSGGGGGSVSKYWNHNRVVRCVRNYDVTDEENRGQCIQDEFSRCYDKVNSQFSGVISDDARQAYQRELELCRDASRKDSAELVCYESCYKGFRDDGFGPRQAESECEEICGL